ncbi:MAG: hypothetical protein RLY34_48 [Actinomycetota bacterium]|jgi:hypothetical protein
MNTRIKKSFAAVALTFAITGLAAGFSGIALATAAEGERPTEASGNVGNTTTSASTTTLPWCGWYINGLSNEIILEGESTYEGVEVDLSGSSAAQVSAFVNGSSTYSATSTNCSWYSDSNKQSASLTVALAEGEMTAFTAATDRLDSSDTSMNFELTSDNKLAITATPDSDCETNNFAVVSDASIYSGQTTSTPVRSSNLRTEISTTNKCSWTMNYATTIPANKTPKYGNETYNYTGPTLVTSLAVADAVAPTP